jgi:hypothetical protein
MRGETMSRAFARHCVVAIVAFVIVLVGFPTQADARPLNSKTTLGVATNGWLHAATAGFGGLLNRLTGRVPTAKKAPDSATPTSTMTAAPVRQTGSCIDPLGRPRCSY